MNKRRLKKRIFISAVVPVFNEEKTVKQVVETLLNSQFIDEVICVNDGSKDKSLEILKSFDDKIILVDIPTNKGKGYALSEGIKNAKGEIIAFFDSDLKNLKKRHIKELLEPIASGRCEVVLGIPTNNNSVFYRPWWVYLTGERAYFRQNLLPYLRKMSMARYGVEILLNSAFAKGNTRIIPLRGLVSPSKYEKREVTDAFKEYLRESVEVARQLAKNGKSIASDYKLISQIVGVKDIESIFEKVNSLKNRQLKGQLRNYLLKYLSWGIKEMAKFKKEIRG